MKKLQEKDSKFKREEQKRRTMFFKNKKGITLIALVTTIIILLILAGVAITMLRGDNRNFKQSYRNQE